ncbi:MAG: hypothetical protein ACE14L_05790 [Terriglobales bacterium]
MDVRAILLLGPVNANGAESLGGVPIALLDVLGRPVVGRVADRLAHFGVSAITVIGDVGADSSRFVFRAMQGLRWLPSPGPALWRTAQQTFSEYAQDGADLVLVLRLGPYLELDYDHLTQTHFDHNSRVTAVADPCGQPLGAYLICASRRNDACFLLRHYLQEFRTPFARYTFHGYANRLATAADLRRLAVDAFCGRAQIQPEGAQIKPGVWVAPSARIHPRARILAPCFIGEHTKVRASAVLTRCAVLEHHAIVDCGTVIEDATVLPYATVGTGLDLAHAVVGFHKLVHLRRNVEVEISDPKLVGMVSPAPVRTLAHAAALASFLPINFVRGLFGKNHAESALPSAVETPAVSDSVPAADSALSNFR